MAETDYVRQAVADVAGGSLESGSGSGFDRFKQIMRTVAPLLAAAYAAKKGALGSFTGGYLDVAEQRRQAQGEVEDRQYRQRVEERQLAEIERRRAEAEAQAAFEREQRENSIISNALEPFEQNPLYAEGIPEDLAGSAVISVPGLGRISLKDALERIGVAAVDGKYLYGKPAPRAPREPLTTGVDKSGRPVRVPDRPGVQPYQKPDKPPKKVTRSYTWKDDDPDSEMYGQSFRIVEDEAGNEISRKLLTVGSPKTASGGVPPSHEATPYRVGDIVTVRGQKVKVTRLLPNGKYEGVPVQ